jgi:ADP-heptose:LPS heptosyltransferase
MRSSNLQRAMDRTIGGWIIRAGSLFRRRRPLPQSAYCVALLQPTAIGDTLIASGVVRAVRERFKGARIVILHGPSNAAALPLIDEKFEAQSLDFTQPWKVVQALWALKPEVVVDLTPWPRTTALCAMASGAVCLGYDSLGQRRAPAFDIPVPHSLDRHEFENARAMAAAIAPQWKYRASIRRSFPPPDIALPYDRLILLHTVAGGSRREEKSWPQENWALLARRLHRAGFVLGFTGDKGAVATVDALRDKADLSETQAVSLAGRVTLPELAYVLQSSRCLVSIDTGIVHLASAVGAPVVGIYGATRSRRWGPWSPGGRAVDSPHPEAGYCTLGFESRPDAPEIMAAVTVDAVYAAVAALLAEQRRAPTGRGVAAPAPFIHAAAADGAHRSPDIA